MGFAQVPGLEGLGDEAVFLILLFSGRLGFALFALGQGFVLTAAAEFFKSTFGLDLGFETLEGTIDRLSFFDDDFWHEWVLWQDNG
jgi:hypothetical protein